MSNFFSVKASKNGKSKISFSKQGVVNFLKNELGFRFSKIGKKGYFLKLDETETYKVVPFSELKDSFLSKMEKDKTILGDVSFEEFKQAFLQKLPYKNEEYLTNLLSDGFELSQEDFHKLSLELDANYQSKEKLKTIETFLADEQFEILVKDSKDFRFDEMFCYKKLNETQYIILHRDFGNILSRETKFDLWVFEAREASWFLRFLMEYPRKTVIKKDFELKTDLDLYKSKF